MAGRALQIVPPGARQVSPGVWQAHRPRRSGGRGGARRHGHRGARRGGKHGFFSKAWVWFAIALMFGEALSSTVFAGAPGWLSVPAMILFAYGSVKKKPGAMNAALALQGMTFLRYMGVTKMVTNTLSSGGLSGLFRTASLNTGNGGGGGGGGGGGAPELASDATAAANLLNAVENV